MTTILAAATPDRFEAFVFDILGGLGFAALCILALGWSLDILDILRTNRSK